MVDWSFPLDSPLPGENGRFQLDSRISKLIGKFNLDSSKPTTHHNLSLILQNTCQRRRHRKLAQQKHGEHRMRAGARHSNTTSGCSESHPEGRPRILQKTPTNCNQQPESRSKALQHSIRMLRPQKARGPNPTWARPLRIAAKSRSANVGRASAASRKKTKSSSSVDQPQPQSKATVPCKSHQPFLRLLHRA